VAHYRASWTDQTGCGFVPVTRFEVMLRRPLAGGRAFGDAGSYEELAGRLHFAVDPEHAANKAITDVALAPRDASGRVAFVSDVSILAPVDRSKISGRLILDVVNRGNKVTVPDFNHATRPALGPNSDAHPPVDAGDGWLMRRGWVVASCGWQCDLPPETRGLVGLEAPDALDAVDGGVRHVPSSLPLDRGAELGWRTPPHRRDRGRDGCCGSVPSTCPTARSS